MTKLFVIVLGMEQQAKKITAEAVIFEFLAEGNA